MYIHAVNASLQSMGWFNLDRMDRVQVLGSHSENYLELKLTQGTTAVSCYISYTDLDRLMDYLRSQYVRYQ